MSHLSHFSIGSQGRLEDYRAILRGRRATMPFQDDIHGLADRNGRPLNITTPNLMTPDRASIESQVLEDGPENTAADGLAQVATQWQAGIPRSNTPVTHVSRGSSKKSVVNEAVRELSGSSSASSPIGDKTTKLGVLNRKQQAEEAGEMKRSNTIATVHETVVSDTVGEVADEANRVEYKTMGWVQASVVMIAETVSLGILSLPKSLAAVGIIPGVIVIILFGLIATYTGIVIWQYKLKHPEVGSIADILSNIFGKPGRWVGELFQYCFLLFIMAAHIVTFSVMMNALTGHGLCTSVFMVVGGVISFVATIPRTFKFNSYLSITSCISIVAATLLAMINIGITRPGHAHNVPFYAVIPAELGNFDYICISLSSIVLAYNGHPAYPSIISEMHTPEDFPKAIALLESTTIAFYIIVAVVIYIYAGQDVSAPALGSASPLIRKIAYGIAIPTIVVAGVIMALVLAKLLYRHAWRKEPKVMEEKWSLRANGSWIAIAFVVWVAAFIIASVIPIFQYLLGLMGALFGTWFALGFGALFWLVMNWHGSVKASYLSNWMRMVGLAVNVLIILLSFGICVLGSYATIKRLAISDSSRMPFSCANNA